MSIQNVYAGDLTTAFRTISDLIERYPFVGIDTEFPGFHEDVEYLALKLNRPFLSSYATAYARFKLNIDSKHLIQLGITLSDADGVLPKPVSTWQFNFLFDEKTDLSQESSLALLREHQIDFARHKTHGIHPMAFSYELVTSGLVFNKNLTYICFHGASDFGYLVKCVTCTDLPHTLGDFRNVVENLFPNVYDLKHCYAWPSSLAAMASESGVYREGIQHQAGSDSWVTLQVFIKQWKQKGYPKATDNQLIVGLED